MEIKDLEKLKKIADANDDIEKINELLQNMSEFRKKSKGMDGNLQFKELRLIGKIKVFQMFREAITTYKDKLSIEELSDIKKSITGEQEND